MFVRCIVDKILGRKRRRTRERGRLGAEATDETLIHGCDIFHWARIHS